MDKNKVHGYRYSASLDSSSNSKTLNYLSIYMYMHLYISYFNCLQAAPRPFVIQVLSEASYV